MVTENGKQTPVYRAKLKSEEHGAAKPYAWPLAHDVRPASQALGARGCGDCHSIEAPVYFGNVLARGPVEPKNGVTKEMWELRGENKLVASTFASSFVLRPMLKYVTFGSAAVVLGVLVNYGLLGLSAVTNRERSREKRAVQNQDLP